MDDLTPLFHETVADVQPTDRLTAIQQRIRRPARTRWYAVGAAGLAVAAAVTAIAVATTQSVPRAHDSGPVAPPSSVEPTPTLDADTVAAAAYYVGDTPSGPRLYREFRRVPKEDPLNAALALIAQVPTDPDYRTLWPAGSLVSSGFDGIGDDGFISVKVADGGLSSPPAGMSADDARLAVQSVVYTLQAAVGGRARVEFYDPGGRLLDSVLGVPAERDADFPGVRAFSNAPALDTLSLVQISVPDEGQEVSGSFTANGAASSFEGTVPWELRNSDDDVVLEGFAQGTMEDHLTPWATEEIDVSDLAPGSYTFVAMTDDPSGGEGDGPTTDTRTVIVQ